MAQRHVTIDYNRMVLAFARDNSWVDSVLLIPEQAPCHECAALAGSYRPGLVPDLPHTACQRRGGCLCWYAVAPHRSPQGAASSAEALSTTSGAATVAVADADVAEVNRRFISLLTARPWIRNVMIRAETEACRACANEDTVVPIGELPALPHRRCTRPQGCGCWYSQLDPARGRTDTKRASA